MRRNRFIERALRLWLSSRGLRVGGLAGLTVALAGCGLFGPDDFVDFSTFDQLPALNHLDVATAEPAPSIEYWELRNALPPADYQVVLSGGSVPRHDLGEEVLATLDSVRVFDGFAPSCLPGGCYHYFATVDSAGEVLTWTTAESVRTLFAPIGSFSEAALIARAEGFEWSLPIETGAVRFVSESWQLVVTKLVRGCDPVQVDRFLLDVNRDGVITELKREVYSREYGVCI
jgi:hypothetical protein